MHRKRWNKYRDVGPTDALRQPNTERVDVECQGCGVTFSTAGSRPAKYHNRRCFLDSLVIPCSVDGCDRRSVKRGWCSKHHQRWVNHGDPEATVRTKSPKGYCCVCLDPRRQAIEADMFSMNAVAASRKYGIARWNLITHARDHVGFVYGSGNGRVCAACTHPDVDAIDELIAERAKLLARGFSGSRMPRSFRWNALASELGLGESVLKRHATLEHQQRRALYELGRLNALKETA